MLAGTPVGVVSMKRYLLFGKDVGSWSSENRGCQTVPIMTVSEGTGGKSEQMFDQNSKNAIKLIQLEEFTFVVIKARF